MRVETVSEARMIDIVAEGYDAGIRLEESVPQDMIAVPLTGRSASWSPPRRTILHATAFRRRRTICFRIRGLACMAHGGIYRWELARRGNVRPADAAALATSDLCLDPGGKSGIGGFCRAVYREELEQENW